MFIALQEPLRNKKHLKAVGGSHKNWVDTVGIEIIFFFMF